jgi:hypothetical protein
MAVVLSFLGIAIALLSKRNPLPITVRRIKLDRFSRDW